MIKNMAACLFPGPPFCAALYISDHVTWSSFYILYCTVLLHREACLKYMICHQTERTLCLWLGSSHACITETQSVPWPNHIDTVATRNKSVMDKTTQCSLLEALLCWYITNHRIISCVEMQLFGPGLVSFLFTIGKVYKLFKLHSSCFI